MPRVFFVESSRANNTAVFSPPANHIRRKHPFNNQFNSVELVFTQETNKQTLAQEQRKKDKTSIKIKIIVDRFAKTIINAIT